MSTSSTTAREAPARPRRRRTPTFWAGLVLVLVGASILGWVGWQTYGTNIVSGRKHADIVEQLERDWQQDGQQDGQRAAGAGLDAVQVDAGAATAILRIPRFGDDYAVPILQGVSDEVLAAGMGHFEEGADAGQVGNYALAGHRITHGEPLRDMPELQPGDEIVVETGATVYTYVLDTGGDDLTVPFTASWVLGERPVNPDGGVAPPAGEKRLITVSTCSELFHTDDRLVAFGHLVEAEPKY